MEFKDYYSALGVDRRASDDDIRTAYRKLARKFHPDVSKEPDADQRMREINEARDVLSDTDKRAAYDALADRVARGARPDGGFDVPPDWDQGFEWPRGANGKRKGKGKGRGKRNVDGQGADFSEFFSSMFEEAMQRQGAQAEEGAFRARGEDHHAAIDIALEDAIQGAQRQISLRSELIGEDGRPRFETRTLDVRIPAGIRPGQYIRLTGQGMPGHGGEPAGDLYLEVRISPHRLWRVEGADLYMALPVTPTEAALGAQVTVPTPAGTPVDVTVPPGARAGMKLRLKERGLPGKPPGHLYLVLEIALPPADTPAARSAYEQLAKAASFDPRAALRSSGA